MSAPVTAQAEHVPVVARSATSGLWKVVCHGCSTEAFEYVYPCQVKNGPEWPPATLADVATVDDARRETATAQAAIDRVEALCDEAGSLIDTYSVRRALGVEADPNG